MATYKGINGFAVQSVASDPSPLNEGQVWYNNATYAFKLAAVGTDVWSSGGNLNTARAKGGAGGVDNSSAVVFGGFATAVTTATESYNGTSWTELNDLNTARQLLGGAGTQTAALGFGGDLSNPPAQTATESWNGTNWTNVNSLNTAKTAGGGAGIQTAALTFGGTSSYPYDPGITNSTEEWNGTSWTSGGNLNTTRYFTSGTGASDTAALCVGGANTTVSLASVESYNGSAWTTGTSLPAARESLTATGTQTSALSIGGNPLTAATFSWNGSTWTATNSMANARFQGIGCGTRSSSIITGGRNPSNLTATEEFNGTALQTRTITTS